MKKFRSLFEIIDSYADNEKGIIFINSSNEEEFLSYAALKREALFLLNNLREKGIKEGSEMIFQFENLKNFIIAFWACIAGKIIPVGLTSGAASEINLKLKNILSCIKNPYLITDEKKRKEQLSEILKSDGKIILISEVNDKIKEADASIVDKDDIALIQFTSGTTGKAKGVVLTHENIIANLNSITEGAGLCETDRIMSWMPLSHDMGLIGMHLTPVFCRANQILMPTQIFIRRPTIWMEKASSHKATVLSSSNFGLKHFINFYDKNALINFDLSNVKIIFIGAEHISKNLCIKFHEILKGTNLDEKALFPVYGLAEASLAVTFPPVNEKMNSITLNRRLLKINKEISELQKDDNNGATFIDLGYPIKGVEIAVSDNDGRFLGENKVGRIFIKGENVTKRYYNNDIDSEKFIKSGWLNTQDMGFIRNKRLFVTGREKDVIALNENCLFAHDVERILEKFMGIEPGLAVVSSIWDEKSFEESTAVFIKFRNNLDAFTGTAKEIIDIINKHTGLSIKKVIQVQKIPKTTSGKIQRFRLKEDYENNGIDGFIYT